MVRQPPIPDPITEGARFWKALRAYVLSASAFVGALIAYKKLIGTPEWWIWLVLAAPFLWVLAIQTFPALWRKWYGRKLIVAARNQKTDPVYFRLDPYQDTSEDRAAFRRADNEHTHVVRFIQRSKGSILVLSGASGTGKTSLLHAAVLPALRQDKAQAWLTVGVRSFDDPVAALAAGLREPGTVWEKPPGDLAALEPAELLARATRYAAEKSLRLLVILDQFEELLVRHDAHSTDVDLPITRLRTLLGELKTTPPDGLRLLLCLRQEYVPFLDRLAVPPLEQDVNHRVVSAFVHADARAFLTDPRAGFTLSEEQAASVLREASALDGTGGLIRPIVLNLLGRILRDRAAIGAQLTSRLLRDHLRALLDAGELRLHARAVLAPMLTESDTKQPRTVAELCAVTGLAPSVIENCLAILRGANVVRELSRSESIDERRWEISHDFLARLLGPLVRHSPWERLRLVVRTTGGAALILWIALIPLLFWWWPDYHNQAVLRKRFGMDLVRKEQGWSGEVMRDARPRFQLESAMPYLKRLQPFVSLDLTACEGLKTLRPISALPTLQTLDLSFCAGLTSMEGLENLPALRTLDVAGCSGLTSLWGLKDLPALEAIAITNCQKLVSVEALNELPALRSLDLQHCVKLPSVDGLRGLPSLHTLDLRSCKMLTNVDGLKVLPSLRALDLSYCERLTNVNGLRQLVALERLYLMWCKELTSVDALRGLPALHTLDLSYCLKLTDAEALTDLPALHTLYLEWFTNVQALRGSNVKNLTVDDQGAQRELLLSLPNLEVLQVKRASSQRLAEIRVWLPNVTVTLAPENRETLPPAIKFEHER